MKLLTAILVLAIAVVVVVMLHPWSRSGSAPGSVTGPPLTLESKLQALADCGLKLADPFTVNDLATSFERGEYEKPGFDLVLVGLGTTEEKEPWRYHCINLWHFDTECIEDHGDYKRIVERLSEMAQGSLPLENIQDYVDLEKKVAWFSFSFQGKEIKVDCKVEDDWVDTGIFAKFVQLLGIADSAKLFIYYDLGGQDCIIGCVTKGELQKLNSHGIRFVPLA